MKKVSLGTFALACFTAVSLSAQATPPPSSDQTAGTSGSSASQRESSKVTVSGCLERAKEASASAGTSGAAGTAGAGASASAAAESKFVLNNVTGSSASATGTSGAAATSPTASSYRLDGEDSKLSPHVGHKIEVTGTVEKSASATGASMSASAPKLKVESVKMIASSCTP